MRKYLFLVFLLSILLACYDETRVENDTRIMYGIEEKYSKHIIDYFEVA